MSVEQVYKARRQGGRRALAASVAALVAAAVGGCGGGSSSSATGKGGTGASSPKAGSVTTVDVVGPTGGKVGIPTAVEGQVAVVQKYGPENGLKVVLQQASGSSTVAALESGKAHFGDINFPAVANAAAAGVPLVIVAAWNLYFPEGIVATKNITSFSQLAGKTIAINALGDSTQALMEAYAGVTKQVNPASFHWLVTGGNSSQALQFVSSGRAAATPAAPETVLLASKKVGGLHFIVPAAKAQAEVGDMGGVIVTQKSYAKQHPGLVESVVRSFIQAQRALYRNEGYFDKIAQQISGNAYSQSQLKEIYGFDRPTMSVNGGMVKALFDSSYNIWAKYEDPKYASNSYFRSGPQLADPSFASHAVKSLGFLKGTGDTGTMLQGVAK